MVGLVNETTVMVNDATILLADMEAGNGIVHVIDKQLMPPGLEIDETVENTVTTGMSTNYSTTDELCSEEDGTQFECLVDATEVVGVLVCRGGATTCTPSMETMLGDICGCCIGDNSPNCLSSNSPDLAVTKCEDC